MARPLRGCHRHFAALPSVGERGAGGRPPLSRAGSPRRSKIGSEHIEQRADLELGRYWLTFSESVRAQMREEVLALGTRPGLGESAKPTPAKRASRP